MKLTLDLNRKHLHYALLGLILALALYPRLDNLANVQRFRGDQSRDYDVLMKWKLDGVFPYLGPYRMVGGDRTIGPGWYYTELPALWLSNFNPSAGAVTNVFFAMLTLWMYWYWIWRTTGSALAALATAAAFAFSTTWVADHRVLWPPHIIPFGAACFALIIEGAGRRPVACLFGFLMLNAIMPHWHSTGIPVMIAAFPPALWAFWRARAGFRAASRREWLGWGAAFAVLMVALYLPPVIHEFKYHTGNLPNYIRKTFIPSPPQTTPLLERALDGTNRMIAAVFHQSFFYIPRPWQVTPSRIAAAVAVILFLLIYGRMLWRDRFRVSLSPAFWALIIGGHWLILVLKGRSIYDYFLHPALAPPLLLGGWITGRLLTDDAAAPLRRSLARGAGWTILALGAGLTLWQFPASWAIPSGKVSYGFEFRDSQKIARHIARDAGGKKFGLLFADRPQNSMLYMLVLTRMAGAKPENIFASIRQPVQRQLLGEQVYLVLGGKLDEKPIFNGPALDLGQPVRIADTRIYRVPLAKIPPEVRSLFLHTQGSQWFLDVKTAPTTATLTAAKP